jgi:predicted dehydrogenase
MNDSSPAATNTPGIPTGDSAATPVISSAPSRKSIERPRIAIVGCGFVGEVHRDRLLQEPIDIVAISDPDANALAQMASKLPRRPRLFRSEVDLLGAGIADAVVLCTPHARHAEQVWHALDAGVHVLCEKPFVTRSDEGAELVRRAREKNLALFVAYTRRSRGHARFLLNTAERIGPIQRVIIARAQPWLQTHRRTWRVRAEAGGGFLVDAGASMLDLLLRLVPAPVEEADAVLERTGGADVDVRGSIRIGFQSGARADVVLMGDATEQVERISVFGENGTAGWLLREDTPSELYVRPAGGSAEIGDPAPYRTLSPDAAFVAALRSERGFGPDSPADLYDAASAVPVVALVERLFQTAEWR